MQPLLKTQQKMLQAILAPHPANNLEGIKHNGLTPAKRLQVYQNNARLILTSYLKTTFPVIVKLGGENFFNYLAAEYIKTHPPSQADITFYGENFPSFISTFPALTNFEYMADVATLEWLREKVFHTPGPHKGELFFSPWAVHKIWQINIDETNEALDLKKAGQAYLHIYQQKGKIVVEQLKKSNFNRLQKTQKVE